MTGKRSSGPASLKLSKTDELPADLREGIRELTELVTLEAERGKGHASMLMQKVCSEADKAGLVLLLQPRSEVIPQDKLLSFYEKFGFQVVQPNPIIMARQAHG